jgi:Family of unknown function (DUF6459)
VSSTALRLVPAPQTEPPYDDEVAPASSHSLVSAKPSAVHGVQGALALNFVLPSGLPAEPYARALRLVETSSPDLRPAALPDPKPWAARLVQAVTEVLAGDRPLTQLLRWVDGEVYSDIRRRVTVHARRQPPKLGSGQRAAVRSVHAAQPTADVSELCVILQRGARAAAVAVRLESRGDRWLCTALEIG